MATLGAMFIAIGWSFAYNGGQALTLHDQPTFFFIGQGESDRSRSSWCSSLALTACCTSS